MYTIIRTIIANISLRNVMFLLIAHFAYLIFIFKLNPTMSFSCCLMLSDWLYCMNILVSSIHVSLQGGLLFKHVRLCVPSLRKLKEPDTLRARIKIRTLKWNLESLHAYCIDKPRGYTYMVEHMVFCRPLSVKRFL